MTKEKYRPGDGMTSEKQTGEPGMTKDVRHDDLFQQSIMHHLI